MATPAFQPARHAPQALSQPAAAFAKDLGEAPGPRAPSPSALSAGVDPFFSGGNRNPSSYLPPEGGGRRAAPAPAAPTAGTPTAGVQSIASGEIPIPDSMPSEGRSVLLDVLSGFSGGGTLPEMLARAAGTAKKGKAARTKARTAERREDRRDRMAEFDMALRYANAQSDPVKGSITDDETGEISLYTSSGQFIPTGKKAGKKTTAVQAGKEAREMATRKTTDEFGLETETFDRVVYDQMVTAYGHPELRLGGEAPDAAGKTTPAADAIVSQFKAGTMPKEAAADAIGVMFKDKTLTREQALATLKELGFD